MPIDKRMYFTVANGTTTHPKVEGLSDKAFRVLMKTWDYCSTHMNDGRLTQASWAKRGPARARQEIVEAELVESDGAGGVIVHDWLQHQRSREAALMLHAVNVANGQKGGLVRAAKARLALANGSSHGLSEGSSGGSTGGSTGGSREIQAEVEVEIEEEQNQERERARAPATRKRAAQIQPGFAVTKAMLTWVAEHPELRSVDVNAQTERFVDHFVAKGDAKIDWVAAWRNWIRRAGEYGTNGAVSTAPLFDNNNLGGKSWQ